MLDRTIYIKVEISACWSALFPPPPDSSKYICDYFELLFDEILYTAVTEAKEIIIMGDINCDFLKRNAHRNVKNTLPVTDLNSK